MKLLNKKLLIFLSFFIGIILSSSLIIAPVNNIPMSCTPSLQVGPFNQGCPSQGTSGVIGSGSISCTNSAPISHCSRADLSFAYSWNIEKYMVSTKDLCSVSGSIGTQSFSENINSRYTDSLNSNDCTANSGSTPRQLSASNPNSASASLSFNTVDSVYGGNVYCKFSSNPFVTCYTCTDSDGGKNYTVRGSVNVVSTRTDACYKSGSAVDNCSGSGCILKEWFCSSTGTEDFVDHTCSPNNCCGGKCCTQSCCGSSCCSQGQYCANSSLSVCCTQGAPSCGNTCCGVGQICADQRMVYAPLCCNSNQNICTKTNGDKFCSNGPCCGDIGCQIGQVCANPQTGLCGDPQYLCGNKFCGTDQVCSDQDQGLCCSSTENVCTKSNGDKFCSNGPCCGDTSCGAQDYCADSAQELCCNQEEFTLFKWIKQGESCSAVETKDCFECTCNHPILGYFYGDCTDSSKLGCSQDQGCCYGNCYDPASEKCCAKDACNNTVIGINECCELQDGLTSPYVSYLNISPDYELIFKNQKEVSYNDVFDKEVRVKLRINDSDCQDTSFKVFYNVTGLTWETSQIISSSIQCNKVDLCTITIPKDKIRPGDNLQISLYVQDKAKMNSTINYTSIAIPYFDLIINTAYPVQVLDGFPLVRNKDTMVKIYYTINSSLITKVDNVNAKSSIAGQEMSGSFNLRKFKNINQAILDKDTKEYNAIKRGGNTINLFSVKAKSDSFNQAMQMDSAKIESKINYDKTIKEARLDNNDLNNPAYAVVNVSKKILIIFVPINTANGVNPTNTKNILSTISDQFNFIKEAYPINGENIKYLIYPPYTPSSAITPPATTVDAAEILLKYLTAIQKAGAPGYDYVFVVGVLPSNTISDSDGFVKASLIYRGATVIQGSTNNHGMSHEIGHILGLNLLMEDYDLYSPYGQLTEDGWRVSAGSNGAKLNINRQDRKDLTDRIDGVGSRYHIYSIMGASSNADNWMDQDTYNYLLNKFKD